MTTLLGETDHAFLASSGVHVDLMVEHAGTGRPLLALELDGPQHQESLQLKRDRRKDRILRVAGLLLCGPARPSPQRGLTRALLHWHLQNALADPDFLRACPPALRESLQSGPKRQHDGFLAT